jgi:hypothetical protein
MGVRFGKTLNHWKAKPMKITYELVSMAKNFIITSINLKCNPPLLKGN